MKELKPTNPQGLVRQSAGALEVGVSVVVGLAIGYALDNWLGTTPWMSIFWLCCGVAAGMRSLYRLAKKLEQEDEEQPPSSPDEDKTR